MYVKLKDKNISTLNVWEDTPNNRKRVKDWNLEIYEGEVSEVTDFKLKVIKGHENDFLNPKLN